MPNLPSWVSEYVGIPFKDKGRSREGCDCWGLVWMIAREKFGIELPRYDDSYESTTATDKTAAIMARDLNQWRKIQSRPGAIIQLRMEGRPCHVGLVITTLDESPFDPNYFIHCEFGVESNVDQYTSRRWERRIEGFFEYAAVS